MLNALKRIIGGDEPVHSWMNGYDRAEDAYTWDNFQLQKKMWWRLFVYNAWQDNQRQHEALGPDAIKCAAAFTEADNFVVLKKKLGKDTYPFALEMGEEHTFGRESYLGPKGRILGQVFLVRPDTLKGLDREVMNGVEFERRRIKVEVPFREIYGNGEQVGRPIAEKMDCWAYIGHPDYWLGPEGHGVSDQYCGEVRRFCTVKSHLNQLKESKVYYYYNDKFEASFE